MNRRNLIAAAVLLVGAGACDRNRTMDEDRVGKDASTTGATVSPGANDRSGTTGATGNTGSPGSTGTTTTGSDTPGSNRMTDTGSAADRDRNLGITRDGGHVGTGTYGGGSDMGGTSNQGPGGAQQQRGNPGTQGGGR